MLVQAVDLDQGMQVLFWNRECELVTGFKSAEIIGNPRAMQMLYPDPAYRTRKMSDCMELAPHFRNLEWTLTTKSGEKRRVRVVRD
mgnify:CR=1 FL=1